MLQFKWCVIPSSLRKLNEPPDLQENLDSQRNRSQSRGRHKKPWYLALLVITVMRKAVLPARVSAGRGSVSLLSTSLKELKGRIAKVSLSPEVLSDAPSAWNITNQQCNTSRATLYYLQQPHTANTCRRVLQKLGQSMLNLPEENIWPYSTKGLYTPTYW